MSRRTSVITAVMIFILCSATYAQQLDGEPYTPGKDANIDMYIGNWKESMPAHTHGSLIERDILTAGDPSNPKTRGAVLEYVNRFTHATLEAHASTTPTTLDGEQEIFFIISGSGSITAGGKTSGLYSGITVLMPAGLEFTMKNTGNESMSMYLISEPYPEDFRLNTEMLVVDENTVPVGTSNAHWVGIVRGLLTTEDGLGTLESILTCSFSPMTFFHPHSHVDGTEEVWTAIDEEIYVLLGKQIRLQTPGTAYNIPPDGKTPHANFNVSDKTIKMFYFARYGDHDVRK
ncbi:cupin domain-containing protein [Candidatus Latescibacterota bacterium]